MNNQKVVDSLVFDGLWDPYSDMHMGHLGELCAAQYGFTREIQDNFAKESVLRSQKATKEVVMRLHTNKAEYTRFPRFL